MGYIVEISESKVENLAENIGKMLHYGGMAMHCIEEMRSGRHMGERGGYGRYGMREPEMPRTDGYDHIGERYDNMGERHHGEWVDDPYMMGERRSMSTGRYIRR